MSHLLHILKPQSKAAQRGSVPLMMEFQVSPETAPYLVTSSQAMLWVEEPHPNDVIKAAVRTGAPADIYKEALAALKIRGKQAQWDTVHPLTVEGIQAAIDHVEFYELGEVEILVPHKPVSKAKQKRPLVDPVTPLLAEMGLGSRPSSWVPRGHVVVVPKDRTFVGILATFGRGQVVAVIHNPARGIAIAC